MDHHGRHAEPAREPQLGATGDYPAGKLNEHDEGAIQIAVGMQKGKVVVDFGTPVKWIAMDPKMARQLAESLRKMSHVAESQRN